MIFRLCGRRSRRWSCHKDWGSSSKRLTLHFDEVTLNPRESAMTGIPPITLACLPGITAQHRYRFVPTSPVLLRRQVGTTMNPRTDLFDNNFEVALDVATKGSYDHNTMREEVERTFADCPRGPAQKGLASTKRRVHRTWCTRCRTCRATRGGSGCRRHHSGQGQC